MAKGFGHFILIIKAILTRVIFAAHGLIAIWQVTQLKKDPYYWYLCASILALAFEGVFTLTIKKNQEWKWFCPSVFFYLCSVVPAIWLLEVHKFDKKLALKDQKILVNQTVKLPPDLANAFDSLGEYGISVPVGDILNKVDEDTWATIIEQLLMLILIIGRWMLPKGGLTRDQLSQLLLVYIGTAADIIEFFDSFKDDKISSERVLCILILGIWSWSLLQFTFVLTATKARRTRITADIDPPKPKFVNGIYKVKEVCCSIDVWAILINIILQDAPFLIFRMLLITYFKIISYMNIFFTAKNTLVIILQFYRLYVVQQEKNKEISKMAKATVSGNLAKAVERAAFIGPTADARAKSGRNLPASAAANKKGQAGNAKKQSHGAPKKVRSQDSISSQPLGQGSSKVLDAGRKEKARTGRRKSLSTGNLPDVGIEDTYSTQQEQEQESRDAYDDDLELGISGSVLSGTNDADSQDLESDVPLDEISYTSERPPPRGSRKARMSENPGIYKISGSRSSEGSSQQGPVRCRQDTGYSSSSKDSGNSNRRHGRIVNGGSRTGRAMPKPASSGHHRSRARNASQRRLQMIMAKELNSIEFGGILENNSSNESEDMTENERIFQRRAAICAVFSLFVVIFMLCMVAIYGGINPRGLVLRETFRVANSTKPKPTTTMATTTSAPNVTEVVISVIVISNVTTLVPDKVKTDTGNVSESLNVNEFNNNSSSNGSVLDEFEFLEDILNSSFVPTTSKGKSSEDSFSTSSSLDDEEGGLMSSTARSLLNNGFAGSSNLSVQENGREAVTSNGNEGLMGLSENENPVSTKSDPNNLIRQEQQEIAFTQMTPFAQSLNEIASRRSSSGMVRHARSKVKRLFGFMKNELGGEFDLMKK